MARLESQALGGYYALPEDHAAPIAALIDTSACHRLAVVDPCAADGAAILSMMQCWREEWRQPPKQLALDLFACELEQERASALRGTVNRTLGWRAEQQCHHGDAFRITWNGGAHVLYLNPPYDTDRSTKRLEQRFLARFTDALLPGVGALIFVVPHYALSASAAYLARHFETVSCFQFFTEAFDDHRQVVLVARRRTSPLPAPDEALLGLIGRWATDAASIPTLAAHPTPVLAMPAQAATINRWEMTSVDVRAITEATRIGQDATGQGLRRYGLDQPMIAMLGGRPYELAMPPRPGHIAQALSAGIMDGAILTADAPYPSLPDLLAKGVFERELVTVEQKKDKKGKQTGVVQIQQPSLRLCVLDIESGQYHDIKPGTVPTTATSLEAFNVADLLDRYRGAMGNVMATMCPAIHRTGDPAALLPLPSLARAPYQAQKEAISATLKLLGRGEQPFVIGEVGTGKSTIALATIAALQAQHLGTLRNALRAQEMKADLRPVERALIVCPPHLLTSWCDQIKAVLPGAGIVVMQSISDVHREVPSPAPHAPGAGLTIFVLSRETAKLSHGVAGARTSQGTCPRCGRFVLAGDEMLAKERRRCTASANHPANEFAEIAAELAALLVPVAPTSARVRSYAPMRYFREYAHRTARRLADLSAEEQAAKRQALWTRRATGHADEFSETPLGILVERVAQQIHAEYRTASTELIEQLAIILGMLLLAGEDNAHEMIAITVSELYQLTRDDTTTYGKGGRLRGILREIIGLLPPNGFLQSGTIAALRSLKLDRPGFYTYGQPPHDPWKQLEKAITRCSQMQFQAPTATEYGDYEIAMHEGRMAWRGRAAGRAAAEQALELISLHATWHTQPECNEPLYSAVPQPRRYSIAKYIARYARKRFDLLVLDEGHEFAGDGSAQEIAAHRLSEMGLPTLLLTGSLMNGYASGLFRNLWALSRRFRREFGRDDVTQFVNRYGYRKVLSESEEAKPEATQTYGVVSDCRDGATKVLRTLGEAPGVLPLLLLQHLLPIAVTIQKSDLDDALPDCPPPQIIPIVPEPENPVDKTLRARASRLLAETANQIGKDAFTEFTGKLFGALGQLPSFYDRATADTGNGIAAKALGRWEVRYPETMGAGLVTSAELFPPSTILPKERWMLATVEQELNEDRNVLIYITHTGSGLSERVQRLIGDQLGEHATILTAGAVSTQKREAWINANVIKPGKRIMIANPVTVQTGLNNLVHFSTVIWYENPSCNAIVFRQANGRVHRIGQTKPVRIFVPIYADTPQTLAQDLLSRKITASEQVDGMDVQASLAAAGAGEREAIDTLELGRAIYAMLTERQY